MDLGADSEDVMFESCLNRENTTNKVHCLQDTW